MRSNIIIAGGLLLFVVIMTTQHPLQQQKEQRITHEGIVTELYETGFKDFVVKLKGRAESYYIDRSLSGNFNLQELKEKLLYKPVVIEYPQRFTPVSDGEKKHFISKLEVDGGVLYDDGE